MANPIDTSSGISEGIPSTTTPELKNITHAVIDSVIKSMEPVISIHREAHVVKDPRENQFYVHVPIGINGEDYLVLISGNLILIEGDSHVIGGRGHPFNIIGLSGGINFLRTVTRHDIKREMSLTLMKDCKIIPIDPLFFDKLRKRIPSNHALSTLPIKY